MASNRRLLLFDFDGTIADSMTVAVEVFNEVAPLLRIGRIATDDTRLRHMNPREALRASAIPLWKVPPLLALVRHRLHRRMDGILPFPDVVEAIDTLSRTGHRCAIVSSNSHANIARFLDRHRLSHLEILGTGAGLFGKPRALRKALARAGVHADRAVYVGDELRDVEAARDVGLRSVAVSWGYAGREALLAAGPDHLVDRTTELVSVLTGEPPR